MQHKKSMTPEAQEAQRILASNTIQQAFKVMRDSCYNEIESSKSTEHDKREDAYYMMKCVRLFEESIKMIIREGTSFEEIVPQMRQMKR